MSVRNTPVAPHAGCTSICCSGYVFVQEAKNMPSANLDNTIHPILQRWMDENPTTLDPKVVDQPFRAMSHILDSESGLQFFHTNFFGKRRPVRPQGNDAVQWEFYEEDWDLDDDQRAKTKEALNELAEFVDFRLGNDTHCGAGSRIQSHKLFAGNRAYIQLHRQIYMDAEISATDSSIDEVSKTWDFFNLMRTLVHELAHAAVKVRWGQHKKGANAWFDTCGIAEEGFELENRLFGGIIEAHYNAEGHANELLHESQEQEFYYCDDKPSYLNGLLEIYDYPYLAKVEEYDAHNLSINLFPDRAPKISVRWRLPIQYLHSLFQRAFWKLGHFDEQGVDSLHPRKEIGYRYKAIGGGLAAPYNPTNANDKNNAVPDGYEVDALGVIRPKSVLSTPVPKEQGQKRVDSALAINPRHQDQTSFEDHMDIDSSAINDSDDEMEIDEDIPARIKKTNTESKHLLLSKQNGTSKSFVGLSKDRAWLKKEQQAEDEGAVLAAMSRTTTGKKEEPIPPPNWHR
ncbi:hypothetical protein HII31_10872 [Pseudocercospora fuligena]|uniref:SprT-like domain-containing protein n=1 Tax=Pseudocercospora fuligena TaxID=685502 RepID=A0A8H6RCK5_9PEZI|nr:hypothetical protein HII31_10872 [Pseudocercospora fuligena]